LTHVGDVLFTISVEVVHRHLRLVK
jgi:hypothetical protein